MGEILVSSTQIEQTWKAYRERFLPLKEIEKLWPEYQKWEGPPPSGESSSQQKLEALLKQILDSTGGRTAEIFCEAPVELRMSVLDRFVRANEFLRSLCESSPGIQVPVARDPTKTLHDRFREWLLHP